jgi:hypothetical protein
LQPKPGVAEPDASGVECYDFSNMSPAQMREAVNGLIRNGEMSLDESSSLLAIMAPPAMRWAGEGQRPSAAEFDQVDNTPVDAFAILRDGIAGARWRHDSAAEAALERTIAALQRVQGGGFLHRYSGLSASGRAVFRLIC